MTSKGLEINRLREELDVYKSQQQGIADQLTAQLEVIDRKNEERKTLEATHAELWEAYKVNLKTRDETSRRVSARAEVIHDRDEEIKALKAANEELKQQKHEIIRKHQEESFNRVESARWTPTDENDVRRDLHRLKGKMATIAKKYATTNMPNVSKLLADQVMQDSLSKFIRWDDERDFLCGIKSAKKATLILNGILAHEVLKNVLGRPFFFDQHLRQALRFQDVYEIGVKGVCAWTY